MTALSVVVMGYLDAPTIVRAVRSVVDQADADTEVVVVTSGGDDTAAQVRAVFPDVPLVAWPTRLLPGGARNAGIAATRGAAVAFLAGDCVAEPGWVAERRRLHAAGHPVVAGAVVDGDAGHLAAWASCVALYRTRHPSHPEGPVPAGSPRAHGCSFTRTVLERIDGFDDAVESGEDTRAAAAVGDLGVPIWFAPSVRTAVWGPRSLRELVRDRYVRGCRSGRVLGPVASTWPGALWTVVRRQRHLRRTTRTLDLDRRRLRAAIPYFVAGDLASVVGRQRTARRIARTG